MKKIIYVLMISFLCMNFSVRRVQAVEVSVPVLANTVETETVEKMNLFEEFYYRMFEKDTARDFFDYILLTIFIVGLLIVMVFQNTHYVVVSTPKETILDEEPVEIESIQVEESPVEVVSSEIVEEEKPHKSRRKKSE